MDGPLEKTPSRPNSGKLKQIYPPLLGGSTGASFGRYRTPVPPQRWHFTTLSPFFNRPLPSQFLHFCFFLILGPFSLAIVVLPAMI
jgi:hypothetical protein